VERRAGIECGGSLFLLEAGLIAMSGTAPAPEGAVVSR
jgi:hypothetical protein